MAKGKTYRTANGGKVDLGALLLSNENTRAVGNMGVNARGDRINSQNEVIETRNEIMQRHYDKAHDQLVVDDNVIPTSAKHAQQLAKERAIQEKREANPEAVKQRPPKEELHKGREEIKTPASMDTMPEHVQSPNTDPKPLPVKEPVVGEVQTIKRTQGGLAAAIAKAKEIKEEPEKTARQMQQEQSGVKRI
jgi:cell division protein YceG involved in septum cleavage